MNYREFTKQALFGFGVKKPAVPHANVYTDDKAKKVREIVAQQLALKGDQVRDSMTWRDLRADDMDKVETAMALEETFQRPISDVELDNAKTVGDLIQLMKRKPVFDTEPALNQKQLDILSDTRKYKSSNDLAKALVDAEAWQPKQASYKKATMNFDTIYNSMKKQALDGSVVPGNPGKPAGLGALGKALSGKMPGLASSAALSGAPTVGAAALGKLPPAKTTTPTAPTEGAVPAAGAGPMNVPPAGATDAAQGQAPETFSEAVNAWTKYEKAKNPQAQVASTQPNTQPTQTPAEAPMMQQPVSPLAKGASLDKRAQLQQMLDAWRAHRVRK